MHRLSRPARTYLSAIVYAGVCLLLWVPAAQGQIIKLPRPDTTAGNNFGIAVALDGTRAVVGASADDACAEDGGAAYVFERDSTQAWTQAARLTARDCEAGAFFGRHVAISGDRVLVAAAKNFFNTAASNAAYVFERDSTGAWHQAARLTADAYAREEGAFATSVALDGDRALVTTSGDPSEGRYGGSAYVFERDAYGAWKRTARLRGSAGTKRGVFGGSGALAGDRLAVSASTYLRHAPGSVYIFGRDPATGTWREEAIIDDVDDFFISVDLEGDTLLVGEGRGGRKQAGRARLYHRQPDGSWQKAETFKPRTPYEFGAFGTSVAAGGRRALIVGYDEQLGFDFNADRVIYLYRYDEGRGGWRYQLVYDIGESDFATSIDADGAFAVVGQASEDAPGAAYVIQLPAW